MPIQIIDRILAGFHILSFLVFVCAYFFSMMIRMPLSKRGFLLIGVVPIQFGIFHLAVPQSRSIDVILSAFVLSSFNMLYIMLYNKRSTLIYPLCMSLCFAALSGYYLAINDVFSACECIGTATGCAYLCHYAMLSFKSEFEKAFREDILYLRKSTLDLSKEWDAFKIAQKQLKIEQKEIDLQRKTLQIYLNSLNTNM